jgi:hypothetical protein
MPLVGCVYRSPPSTIVPKARLELACIAAQASEVDYIGAVQNGWKLFQRENRSIDRI